jgi:hypothetical protein
MTEIMSLSKYSLRGSRSLQPKVWILISTLGIIVTGSGRNYATAKGFTSAEVQVLVTTLSFSLGKYRTIVTVRFLLGSKSLLPRFG